VRAQSLASPDLCQTVLWKSSGRAMPWKRLEVWPLVGVQYVVLFMCMLFPAIVLWLPRALGTLNAASPCHLVTRSPSRPSAAHVLR
jgi:hypothetical protein